MRLFRTRVPGSKNSAALIAAVLVLFVCVQRDAAVAADPATPQAQPFWREAWIGADATTSSWLVFSGVTLSPLSGIHDDGPRLRFATGYGGYSWEGTHRTRIGELPRGAGRFHYAEGLAGYLKRLGPLTAKAFIGISMITHDNTSGTTSNDVGFDPIHGSEIGLKTGVELWLNIGHRGWSSLDLNWTSAHDTYSARFRTGWRAWPTVSLGIEGIVNGDGRYDIASFLSEPGLDHIERRVGAFARYEWYGGEVSLAGGLAAAPEDGGTKPYATLNWITQF